MTEAGGGAWRQASYHPFALTSRYGRGMVLHLPPRSPVHETGAFGDVPVLDAVAVASDEGGVTLFAVNRDQATPVALEVDARSLPSLSATSHVAISDDDPDAPAGRAAAPVLEHDPAELATAVPARRCMPF